MASGQIPDDLVIGVGVRIRYHAFRFRRERQDLIQEGWIGAIEAWKRFEEARDVSFLTFADWWIRRAMLDYVWRSPLVRTRSKSQKFSFEYEIIRPDHAVTESCTGDLDTHLTLESIIRRMPPSLRSTIERAASGITAEMSWKAGGNRKTIIAELDLALLVAGTVAKQRQNGAKRAKITL